MKIIFTILSVSILFSCSNKNTNEQTSNGFDILFNAIDNESNELNIGIKSYYSLTNRSLSKLERDYSKNYKDSLLIPIVHRITRANLKQYSPGEIYNYKRPEIEQNIIDKTKIAFDSVDVELTKLFITTVKIPDDLMKRLEKEHVELMKKN